MKYPANVVSIHPYFKVHAGKLPEFKALLPRFIELTKSESGVLNYDFTLNGDVVYCREAYVGAAGALAHIANVGALLGEAMTIADVVRLEIHGPAAELDLLRGPLGPYNPDWFVFETGLRR